MLTKVREKGRIVYVYCICMLCCAGTADYMHWSDLPVRGGVVDHCVAWTVNGWQKTNCTEKMPSFCMHTSKYQHPETRGSLK